MPVSQSTVEAIFRRLLARYGSAWRLKWAGVPETDVKADWLNVLGLMPEHAIRYGLENLPADFPPTAYQFREACARAPERRPEPPLLDAPKPDPARLKRELERLHSLVKDRKPTDWIGDLEERERNGERLSLSQRKCIAEAKINLGWVASPFVDSQADRDRTLALKAETKRKVEQYAAEHGIDLREREPIPTAPARTRAFAESEA